jgi:hypothetical protein
VTVLANPKPGYQLDFWSVNGTNGGSSLPYVTTLRGPTNLTARFRIASIELSALVSVYGGRPDLVTAFPQAKLGNYGALVKWANGVVSGQTPDSSYTTLLPYSYWYALMATYQNRPDLQAAFPNAYSSLSSYQGLINWAGGVTSQAIVDSSFNGLKPYSYWYILMMVYNTRSDLQSAFPNAYANQNNFHALVSWAGGVSTSSWPDGSYNVLAPNGYWYDLLSVYNSRADLQSAFPNAYSSWTSYTSMVTWAGGVVTHHWTDGSYGALNTYGYWYDLMMVYNTRPDLRAAFPHAYTSSVAYQSLINWANNVVTRAIADSSFNDLNYYASYYETHHI